MVGLTPVKAHSPSCSAAIVRNLYGFTLVELLVTLALAGIVAAAAGSALLAQMRLSTSLELAQRQRDDASRLNYLIQIEAGEAASVQSSLVMPDACSAGGIAVATFAIPRDTGSYLSSANVSRVYYFNKDGDLWRCGPPIHRNGVIDHDSSKPLQAGVAVRNATIASVTCSGEVTDGSQFAYQLTFGGSSFKSPCALARAKTLLVCNVGESGC